MKKKMTAAEALNMAQEAAKKIEKDFSLEVKAESQKEQMIAKKDFKIVHNNYVRDIKVGEDLSDIPSSYVPNLKAENVI